ncbi:MAG: hypothetical protein Q9169_008527 [Polycauliona sp. 2 TL-2023]
MPALHGMFQFPRYALDSHCEHLRHNPIEALLCCVSHGSDSCEVNQVLFHRLGAVDDATDADIPIEEVREPPVHAPRIMDNMRWFRPHMICCVTNRDGSLPKAVCVK